MEALPSALFPALTASGLPGWRKAAERAELFPDLPLKESYQKEVLTGIYSR